MDWPDAIAVVAVTAGIFSMFALPIWTEHKEEMRRMELEATKTLESTED